MSVRPTPEPAPVLNTTRPFTPRDAAAAGLDPKRLRRLGHSPVLRGVWISSSVVVDTRVRALATLLLAGPDSWIRGRTAARHFPHPHGSPAPGDRPQRHFPLAGRGAVAVSEWAG